MTITAPAESQYVATQTQPLEPLTFLARVAQAAVPPDAMPSLAFQLASAFAQLGSFLRIRGDECVEHYYATALTVACLEPAATDVRTYEGILLLLLKYDRRAPALPRLVPASSDVRIQRGCALQFIQQLRDQRAFQAIYAAGRHIDAYGARSQSPRKTERILLLSRELSGRSCLGPLSGTELLYATLTGRS